MKKYSDESIQVLKGADRIRVRPAAVLGSDGIQGAQHGFIEILGNALDEASSGYGDRLVVKHGSDGSLYIRDFGRGIPLGYNDVEGKWNHYLIFEEMYAGGKYETSQQDLRNVKDWDNFLNNLSSYQYLFSVGLNGLGAMATQCSSAWFNVNSIRDGVQSRMEFREGCSIWDEPQITTVDKANGTEIHWKPDSNVFKSVNIPTEWVYEKVRYLPYIAGIDIEFEDPTGSVEELKASDIKEWAKLRSEEEDVLYKFHFTKENLEGWVESSNGVGAVRDESKDRIAVTTSEVALSPGIKKDNLKFFNNLVEVSSAAPSEGYVHSHRDGTLNPINNFFYERGLERGVRLKPVDYLDLISVIASTKSNIVSPRGQTKDYVDDNHILDNLSQSVTSLLASGWASRVPWLVEAVEVAIRNAEIRVQSNNLEEELREVNKVLRKRDLPKKFISCENYSAKNKDNELWLLEGDSASSIFKAARDPKFQCGMPLKGKGMNALKRSATALLANDEVSDLTQILGAGVDLGQEDGAGFDIEKLRCNKIIIASDADDDGFHIRGLMLLLFYKLFPEIVERGMLYVVETPLYVIRLKDGTRMFAKDAVERDKILEENRGNVQGDVARFKGLGEMNPEDLRESMNPETRELKVLQVPRNDLSTNEKLEALFGSNVSPRKKIILENLLGKSIEEEDFNISDMLSQINESSDWESAEVKEVEL